MAENSRRSEYNSLNLKKTSRVLISKLWRGLYCVIYRTLKNKQSKRITGIPKIRIFNCLQNMSYI